MEYDRDYLKFLRKPKEDTEVTAKAIIGVIAAGVVLVGLAVMWFRGRRRR